MALTPADLIPPPRRRDHMAERVHHDHSDAVEIALADADYLAQRIVGCHDAWVQTSFGLDAGAVQRRVEAAFTSYRRGLRVTGPILAAIGFASGIVGAAIHDLLS